MSEQILRKKRPRNLNEIQVRQFLCKLEWTIYLTLFLFCITIRGYYKNKANYFQLDLSNNQLKSLEGCFEGLKELTELRLSNNSINHVYVEVFRPLAANLHTLDMSGNQLTELPNAINILRGAKQLDFSGNRIS